MTNNHIDIHSTQGKKMFKKFALFTIMLFSYTNPIIAEDMQENREHVNIEIEDEGEELSLDVMERIITQFTGYLEAKFDQRHTTTFGEVLDFFQDEIENHAHRYLLHFYINGLEIDENYGDVEAIIELGLKAAEIAQDNIDRRPETKAALEDFIKRNIEFLQKLIDEFAQRRSHVSSFAALQQKLHHLQQ
ncbi:MAG: hypothetical protein Q8S31_01745 [Alphaproteobacteria bacterium]|nr:hypothetical protein [Alphaproteobacteria bacterium]